MSFERIIGQDIAVKSLKTIIAQNQVRGTYLFLGPDGVGKRTTSIEFAKVLNCEDNKGDACDRCASCNKIDSMNHPDVFVLYPEVSGSIKIVKIREVIYQSSLKPYEGRKRIFIINDGEAMTEEAQNAFLKLLEEPPENHIFILTTSNVTGLFPTVVSRCKILKFYSLGPNQIQEFLISAGSDEEKATLFSHMAMGSLGRAMDYKEKDIITQRDQIVNDFFLRKSVLLREDVLSENADKDTEESLYLLLCWYRDLLVSKFMQDDNKLLNIDRYREIFSYADRFSQSKLQRDLLSIMNTIDYMRRNVNPKIALFNMAVELKKG
jgi:DNA polymerase-3 subunit delta'